MSSSKRKRKNQRPNSPRQDVRRKPAREDLDAEIDEFEEIAGTSLAKVMEETRLERLDDPLDAELAVSELLGMAWEFGRSPESVALICGGLIAQATRGRTANTLAMVRALAVVAPRPYHEHAATAARILVEAGVPEPSWKDTIGLVDVGECWSNRDVSGFQETVVCGFRYADKQHALCVLIDYPTGGLAKDAFFARDHDGVVAGLRERSDVSDTMKLERISGAQAGERLRESFTATETAKDWPIGEGPTGSKAISRDFAASRALAWRRIDLL
jgi:hypothetical protein